ncbi:MAG: DoxX family protein [Pseudomonadota bacterium]|nr:DoxX family protein [Pseudomonadota bacterium]
MARSASFRTHDGGAADAGRLILRLVIGLLILLHGIGKLPGPPQMIAEALARRGLPEALAYAVYLGEIVAPVLLIVGIWTRLAALVVVVNMIVAVLLVHLPQLLSMGPHGGYALELQAMYLFAAVAVALLGAGRYSIGGRFGPLN